MQQLSVFITTFNNADTLEGCLESVAWAGEIVVLDSFSTDPTVEIAESFGCVVRQHEFQGYGRQKQMALEQTRFDWVLLLDADEMLSGELSAEIRSLLHSGPTAAGYELARCEQVFWRMNSPRVRLNGHLRLFDKRRGRLSDMPIHAAPKIDGPVARLRHPFFHFGEPDIHAKVGKVNAYSTGLVADRLAKGKTTRPVMMLLYPLWFFFRGLVLKRGLMDGWAGFISAVVNAFYAFLRYAKVYERQQRQRYGDSLLPPRRRSSSTDQSLQGHCEGGAEESIEPRDR